MTPRYERLLAMIADRPDGAKADIPAIIRAFTPTQKQIVAAIEHLIADGKLDAETLRRPTCAENQTDPKCLTETPAEVLEPKPMEPPAPKAAEGEGGAARSTPAPPSIDLDRLLECFTDEFETLRVVAMRFGVNTPQKIVRHARTLHKRGRVEQAPPVSGQPFLLWRRANSPPQNIPENIPAEERTAPTEDREASDAIANIAFAFGDKAPKERPKGKAPPTMAERARQFEESRKQNTQGVSGTPKEDPGASSSGDAKRTEGRTPIEEPAPAVVPSARARPVDIKVNARRDPTQAPEMPLTELRDRQIANGFRQSAAVRRGQEKEAATRLDSGQGGRNSVERSLMSQIARRREEEARLGDPIEQAKAVLRKKFTPVVSAEFADPPGPPGKFLVGRKIVTEQELLAMARGLAA